MTTYFGTRISFGAIQTGPNSNSVVARLCRNADKLLKESQNRYSYGQPTLPDQAICELTTAKVLGQSPDAPSSRAFFIVNPGRADSVDATSAINRANKTQGLAYIPENPSMDAYRIVTRKADALISTADSYLSAFGKGSPFSRIQSEDVMDANGKVRIGKLYHYV